MSDDSGDSDFMPNGGGGGGGGSKPKKAKAANSKAKKASPKANGGGGGSGLVSGLTLTKALVGSDPFGNAGPEII